MDVISTKALGNLQDGPEMKLSKLAKDTWGSDDVVQALRGLEVVRKIIQVEVHHEQKPGDEKAPPT